MHQLAQTRAFRRFWEVAGGVSIRVKVLGIVIGVIVLLAVFVAVHMRSTLFSTLRHELEHQGGALSVNLAAQAHDLLEQDAPDELVTYLHERKAHFSSETHNTIVDYIIVIDSSGALIAHTFDDDLPTELEPFLTAVPAVSAGQDVAPQAVTFAGKDVLDLASPMPGGGFVRLGLGEANIHQTVNTVTLQIFTITVLMIAIGFAAAFFLTWILTRPIYDLVEATQAIARGDLNRRVGRWANDELGDLAVSFNDMADSLANADRERRERELLREQYVSGVIIAQEDERKRIARELHDSTSQSLTSLLVGLQNLKNAGAGDELECRIEELRQVISGTLDEVRTISWRLRPAMLDDLGLIKALERYIADYEGRYGIAIDFMVTHVDERLPVAVETAVYRIVQEALTNIARYAQAESASVIIDRRGDRLRVIVEDDGVGFNPDEARARGKSLGLQGIRERASLFGGTLAIESQPGQGASLFIEIPLKAEGVSAAAQT